MSEKTVREMNDVEKRHHSLSVRVFHSTLLGAIVLGVVSLAIGLGLYTYALLRSYISESFNLSNSAACILKKVVDVESLSNEVMQAYKNQSEAELNEVGSEAYKKRFSYFTQRDDYKLICSVLSDFLSSSNVQAIYLAMYDRESSSIVYIADPDETENICLPCDWEKTDKKAIDAFFSWDGSSMLYDIEKTEKWGWICTSGVPVKNKSGEIVSFVLSDISLLNVREGMKNFLFQYLIAMLLLVNIVGIVSAKRMKKYVVTPINLIASAAQKYVDDKKNGKTLTEHFSSLNIRTGDEVENLGLIMEDMEKDLSEYEKNLTKVTAEKERIGTELALANRIQADMLPNIYPAFPDRPEFDIYAKMNPAREVGGDFYDYFLIDDDHLYLVMADVSGKGVPAALFMMASKIILGNNALAEKSPAKILEKTNEIICSNNRENMFVTVWLGILEISTGKLTCANAGHEYPAVSEAGKNFELLHDPHGLVVGGMAGMKYKDYVIQLKKGSKVFVYTDGVPEATASSQEMYGTDRMVEALNQNVSATTENILANVRSSVDGFVKDAEQFDDLTMMCLEYIGS